MLELPGPHHITLWKSGFKEVQKKKNGRRTCAHPSRERMEATTACWTSSNREMLKPTKKDTPHEKTKKSQRDGRRGAITMKSNPIPARGWRTNCRTINHRSSPTTVKVLSPTSGVPACGSSKGTRNPQGIRRCRPVGFGCRTSTALGETEGTHRTQGGGAGAPQETEPSLPIVLEGLLQRCGWQWFTLRTRGLAGAVLRSTSWCEFSWRPPQARPQRLEAQGWVLRPNN